MKVGWKCSHNPFTGTETGETCCDKEVRTVGQSFEVTFDIGEVAVLLLSNCLKKDNGNDAIAN